MISRAVRPAWQDSPSPDPSLLLPLAFLHSGPDLNVFPSPQWFFLVLTELPRMRARVLGPVGLGLNVSLTSVEHWAGLLTSPGALVFHVSMTVAPALDVVTGAHIHCAEVSHVHTPDVAAWWAVCIPDT